MICEICHGEGSLVTLFGETRPCPECNGSGVASCCDTAGAAFVSLPPLPIVKPARARRRAEKAYVDPSFIERECDHCGKPYRGPAVYCSLTCALADA